MRSKLALFFTLILVSAAAVRAQDVSVDFDRKVDFSKFKTYSWTSGIPAKNFIIDRQIKADIEEQLAAKGLRRVEEGGELTVLYLVAVEADLQVSTSNWVTTGDWMRPITTGMSVKSQMWDVEVGTLVVCFSDASKNLLWRGTAKTRLSERSNKQDALEAMVEDAKKAEKKIKRAVVKMLKQYPLAKSAG